MSHYFSLVRLQRGVMFRRETRDTMRKLALQGDSYRDHCLMMKLFPQLQEQWERTDREQRTTDFVFRLRTSSGEDSGEASWLSSSGTSSYYLVSRERPQTVGNLLDVQTKEFAPQMQLGEQIRFQLRANPSVTRSRGGAESPHGGKRRPNHDVLMIAKRETADPQARAETMNQAAAAWLLTRAGSWGLQVDPQSLFADGYKQHRLRRAGQRISFSSVDYTGVAQVTNQALLHRAMVEGVGRKRGFGCGLLLVRRLHVA